MKKRILGLIGLLLISSSLCAMTEQAELKQTQVAQNELIQQLISAAKVGDAAFVKELLKRGDLKLGKDQLGYTAFDWAAIRGHIDCVNIILDAFEANSHSLRHLLTGHMYEHYMDLQLVRSARTIFVPLFQRDVRSLTQLAERIDEISELVQRHQEATHEGYLVLPTLRRILAGLKVQFSLNFVLSCSDDKPALQQALVSAGAQHVDKITLGSLAALRAAAPSLYKSLVQSGGLDDDSDEVNGIEDLMHMHIDELVHVAIQQDNKELLKALIDVGASVNNPDDSFKMPLHHVARKNNADMAKMLLAAGAMIEYEDPEKRTPFAIASARRSFEVMRLLFESGAQIRPRHIESLPYLLMTDPERQLYFKMLLQGSKRRYAPTMRDAKIALQNIVSLVYQLGIQLSLPPYVIYEVLLFATAEKRGELGQKITPEWTQKLKRDLAVLYLYKCNGNRLFPLWEQTVRCIVKDPQQQALLISKLESFMQPFLGNEVISIVISGLMQKVAEENALYVGQEIYREDIELYRKHLAGHLGIDGLVNL